MGPLARGWQWLGLTLVLVSAFGVTSHFVAYPAASATSAAPTVRVHVAGGSEVPARELSQALVSSAGFAESLWEARRWYPWYLVVLWIVALAWARAKPGRRRLAGGVLLATSLGLLAFEAAYLHAEYLPFLSGVAGQIEGVCAWLFVAAILLWRRRADRTLGAMEATIASQALLGFVHALTLPATMARGWMEQHDLARVGAAVWVNFPVAFWIGTAGLLLAALPAYLRPADSDSSRPPS
ncbi:MAG: hypothetical protein O2894_12350 [Planctomycetota bacterium]|nr:hypothetical protein [Planctomycetota bacterium]